MPCACVVASVGYCAIALILYKILGSLYNLLYPYFIGTPIDLRSAAGASWAVVTGATDGIGRAYAYQLASRGFNIYLISRTQSKLDDTKKDIQSEFEKVEVKTYAFDFCEGSPDAYVGLLEDLDRVEVGVLINNVGMSYEYPEVLHEVDGGVRRVGAITTINTLPPTVLCAHLIKQMLPRKKGIIVNVASAACYNHMALWAVYSSSKKYVAWLSEILRMEYLGTGLIIQTICPMLVATKMSKLRKTSFFTPNAETFVKSALRTVGLVEETAGFLSHQMQVEAMKFIPTVIVNRVLTNFSMATRKAALKKREKIN